MSETLYARVQAAMAGTSYRLQRTGRGFDMTVNVPQVGRHTTQVHTYRVELHPREKTFTMTDIVRTRGEFGSRTVERGRATYRTWGRSLDGGERTSFSSADGHRLIREAARELGWQELRPTSAKVALAFGVIGGLLALGTLVALAVVFWP
ncbi:hypothetical protein [Streptomyces venezuelae]